MNKKQLVPSDFSPIQEVPAAAPVPPTDLSNPHLSADDILTENYFSMANLEQWLEDRDAESRILTAERCTVEYLYDPQKDKDGSNGEWKPVLWFAETDTGLVINKSRSQQLRKLTGSPLLSAWADVGQITIKPGIANGKAQIVIGRIPRTSNGKTVIPEDYSADDANEELFG